MGKALLLSGGSATGLNTAAEYQLVANTGGFSTAVEAQAQLLAPVAGTFSLLGAYFTTTAGGSRSIKSRIGAANGAQALAPVDGTSGWIEDATHSDAVSSGDLFDVSGQTSSSSGTRSFLRLVFSATSDHATIYGNSGNTLSAAATTYPPINGGLGSATEAVAQSKLRAAGTLTKAGLNVSFNPLTGTTNATLRNNGSDTAVTIAIAAGLTGRFSDTTHTASVSSGDLVNWKVVAGSGSGSISYQALSVGFVNTSDTKNDVLAGGATTRAASGTTSFYTVAGFVFADTTEAEQAVQHGFGLTASRLRINVTANTYAADATLTLRINGSNATQTVTIPAGTTGWFEDTTHSDNITATDTVCYATVGGTSGSITIAALAMLEQATTGVAGAAAVTLGGMGAAAAGAALVAGASAVSLAPTTTAAASTVLDLSASAVTLGALTGQGAGVVPVAGATAVTLDGIVAAAAGVVLDLGAGTITLGALTLDATASGDASVDVTLGGLTASGAGVVTITGAGAVSLGAITATATGDVLDLAAGSSTLGALTISASAGAIDAGALGTTLAALSLSAAGQAIETGDGIRALSPATLSAAGIVTTHGALAAMLGPLTVLSDVVIFRLFTSIDVGGQSRSAGIVGRGVISIGRASRTASPSTPGAIDVGSTDRTGDPQR